jgi:glycosyltransferase involved in cell wall biosynthesis
MMRIAVNTAFLPGPFLNDYILLISKTFKCLADIYPEYHFIFFCEKEQEHQFSFISNSEIYRSSSHNKNTLTLKYWYDVKVPALLRKYKADLFFSPGGRCSSFTKLPQCILINDPLFIQYPGLYSKRQVRIAKSELRKSIKKAKKIITLSGATKNLLLENFSVPAGNINIVYNGVSCKFRDVNDALKQAIKLKYTAGKEYFFYAESFHPNGNLIHLLKAFSLFKKRQQSNFQLIIYRTDGNGDPAFTGQLATYKYRADVKMVSKQDHDDIDPILASAYAFIYPVFTDDFCHLVTRAMTMGVPVITSMHTAMEEITGGSGLYVSPRNAQEIAESMMRIYKDEKMRNEMIEKGKVAGRNCSTMKTAEGLWSAITGSLD